MNNLNEAERVLEDIQNSCYDLKTFSRPKTTTYCVGGINSKKNFSQALSTAIDLMKQLEDCKGLPEIVDSNFKGKWIKGIGFLNSIGEKELAKQLLDLCRVAYVKRENELKEAWSQSAVSNVELNNELQAVKKELAGINETYRNIIEEKCPTDEVHCTCVPALRKRCEELERKFKTSVGLLKDNTIESEGTIEKLQSRIKELTTTIVIISGKDFKKGEKIAELEGLLDKYICKNCYGKGYSTEYQGKTIAEADFVGDKSIVLKGEGIVKHYCSCIVGQRLKAIIGKKK